MSSKIIELARIITENTVLVEEHLQSNNEPSPSLDINAPKKLPTTGNAELARMKAISAANELSDLLKGPAELIRYDWTEHSSLRIIQRLGIPEMVPVGGEVSFEEIAEKTKLPERDVKRILRHAMSRHIFVEPRKGFVAHSAISTLLAEDEQQKAIASTVSEVLEPSLLYTADAVQKFPGSEEANEAGFSLAKNPGKSMWETFSENPEMGRKFGVFIGEAGANESLLGGVDWKGVVVDVGGSHGDAMIDVLRRHEGVKKVVVQDLEDVVEAGRERAPKELVDAERLEFQAHNFFEPQQQQADIFFLRWIFHNWSNKYSVEILRNLIPAMKPGTKVIVNDFVLPEPNTLPPSLERAIRNIDMTMLSLLNATERDEEGWHELFKEADPRFRVQRIGMTPPGLMGIIEVVWDD